VCLNPKFGELATDNNIKYFLNFSNPTLPEKVMGTLVCAMIAYAIQMMKKAGQDGAKPLSIHKFLLEQSKSSAMAMSLFKCLCDYENLIVVHHAKRCNDFEVYQSTLRLSLRIFPTRHATSYMRTVTDLLKYLWMCSPAERKIITE